MGPVTRQSAQDRPLPDAARPRSPPALTCFTRLVGVRVSASGGFTDTWASTDIDYRFEVDSPASTGDLDSLLRRAVALAEIPRAIRAGTAVGRLT